MIKIAMPLFCKQIMESDRTNFLLYGGRLGGKTNNTAKISILTMLMYPYADVIVSRVSYGSLADSSCAEIEAAINEMGENISEEFKLKKSPLRIERRGNSGTIYFIGYGGSNTSRTKSIKTKHKIKIVIMEETQELKDKQNLDEALASFRRHFGEGVKVFVLGNPKSMLSHWFSRFIEEKKYDADWEVMNVTYLDILPFINDYDLKEIIKTKLLDDAYYRWFYLGEYTHSFGGVYPMFRPEKHVITALQWAKVQERSRIRPVAAIIGIDGAVNNDCSAAVPLILLNNGQSVVGPIFYHNPNQDGVIGYHQLVQDRLLYWFENVCKMFHLGSLLEFRQHPYMQKLPIFIRVDSAASDLIAECRFFMSDRCDIQPVKKSNIPEMVSTMQSAILNENLIVIDYGGYYNYTRNEFVKLKQNILVEQLMSLVWNEKQTDYDPIIPNDVSDACTYATISWFKSPENIQYFNIAKMLNRQTILIRDILNAKE